MNTTLQTYSNTLDDISAFQTMTLAARRQYLAKQGEHLATPERVSEYTGERLHNAGMTLLESIQAEIREQRPDYQRDAELEELEAARAEQAESQRIAISFQSEDEDEK